MRAGKRNKLEAAGFKVGDVADFLGLSESESELINIRISLARELRALRRDRQLTQVELAKRIHSSQSRVAKMEAGDPSVSIDSLFRSMVALGASRTELSKAVAA